MKKKIVSTMLICAMGAMCLAGCRSTDDTAATTSTEAADTTTSTASTETTGTTASTDSTESTGEGVALEDLKVGVIYVGDENEGYTEAHMEGIQEMKETLGLSDDQVIEKTNIPESEECYDAAVDLANQGCQIIIANSFGHESYMLQAASEYPDVEFCHATGYQAASSGLDNFHNFFTKIYEARYVSGVVAGMKLNEMIDDGTITEDTAKMGYVGAFPYAEVISGFTSFYLGAKSVCPSVTMEVQYTNSWADLDAENQVATKLIQDGCVLISQHADTTGAPTACEAAGVPCVGYNVDMTSVAPNTALTSATNNWGPLFTEMVQDVLDGTEIPTDLSIGYAEDGVAITPLNESIVAEGTQDKVDEVEAAIKDGSLHVFDTSTFTVGGESLEDAIADGSLEDELGDSYDAFAANVSDGYYHESETVSAPSFAVIIDGITSVQSD